MTTTYTPPRRASVNYLNNRDILQQIHLSKQSYSEFLSVEDHAMYDYIVTADYMENLVITEEDKAAARAARIKRLNLTECEDKDVVFRVMTYSHIPKLELVDEFLESTKVTEELLFEFDEDVMDADPQEDEKILATAKKHVKVNFPPFQHIMLDGDTIKVVGKSHWSGGLETGNFDMTKGRLTETLGKMFYLLIGRISTKFNFRRYTYLDELQSAAIVQLTLGGLKFNEARGSNPFSFYTTTIENAFKRVLSAEKKHQTIRDDLFQIHGLNPSFSRQMQQGNGNE
jgi:hypothetical protein